MISPKYTYQGDCVGFSAIGVKFGSLKVVEQLPTRSGRPRNVVVQCVCGKKKTVRYNNLIQGYTTSCGYGKCHYSKRI